MDNEQHIETMKLKLAMLTEQANAAHEVARAEIARLADRIELLGRGLEVVKESVISDIVAEAEAARPEVEEFLDGKRREFAAQKIVERQAMVERGEDIEVPKSIDDMLAILDAQENQKRQ